MTTSCIIAFACLMQVASLFGQEKTIRILYLDKPKGAPQTLHLFDGKHSKEVELPKLNLSQIYKLHATCEKLWLNAEAIKNADSIDEKTPSVEVPKDSTDLFLLVTSAPENETTVNLTLIDAGNGAFTPGQMLWTNLSDSTIEGTIGNQKISLEPQQQLILDKPAEAKGTIAVKLNYVNEGTQAKPICDTQWSYNPKNRTVGFCFRKNNKPVPVVQNFLDFRIRRR